LTQFLVHNLVKRFGRKVAPKPLLDPRRKKILEVRPSLIPCSWRRQQTLKGVLFYGLPLQSRERFQALMLLVRHIDR
jgi:hypothetical protein